MSEITTDTTDLSVAFNIDYWGDIDVYGSNSTARGNELSSPSLSGAIETARNLNYAWGALAMGQLGVDPVPSGERFDIFDPKLSGSFHQSPGTVVLVDVETITEGCNDIYERQDAANLFASSASDFLRTIQMTQAGRRDLGGRLRFSNPNGAEEWYERRVSILGFVEANDGTSFPVSAKVGWSVRGLIIKPEPARQITQGLPIIGRSYATTDIDDELIDVRRIRSVDVISGSSMRPPKKAKQENKVGTFIGRLLPAPAPSPVAY